MKELLDLARWLSRHPRFRSLMRFLPGGGYVQIGDWGAGFNLFLIGPDGLTHLMIPVFPPHWYRKSYTGSSSLLAAATRALALRARQLARRYPVTF